MTRVKITVTGGSGFIGKAIVRRLSRFADVTVLDLVPPEPGVRFVKRDLRVPSSLPPDTEVCIQLASIVGGIQYFSSHQAQNARDNSLILANVFEAARRADVRRILYASSSVVYQFARTFPTPEDEVERIPPPSSTYGFSKLLGEYFCRAYARDYNLNYTVLRPFNAYGPGEGPDPDYAHAIPQLAGKILDGQYPIEIYGDGQQTRCFTYVEDIVDAFVLCMDHPAAENETFNVSSQEEVTIKTLLEIMWSITGQRKPLKIKRLEPFLEDVRRRRPAIDRIRERIGWSPTIPLDEGLKVTIDWIKQKVKGRAASRTI